MTYKIAIYPGCGDIYNGQPIVVVLDPKINYLIYPDYPHINIGGRITENKVFMPDSL